MLELLTRKEQDVVNLLMKGITPKKNGAVLAKTNV